MYYVSVASSFDSADKVVAESWRDEVREEECIRKETLRCDDKRAEKDARLAEGRKRHEVHSLNLRFFQ